MNIYVSNLSYNTNADSLQELFADYGEVTSVNVVTDRETGRSRGFGFVEMRNDAEGQKAIDELNEAEFDGKTINVNVARPKTERSNGGGFNRGGGGFNRGGGGGYNRNRY
jgi:RNA recognition motif-containing protein